RPVQAPPGHGDLMKRLAYQRIEHATIDGDGRRTGVEAGAAVELERGPGRQVLLPLELGEAGGVARDSERLLRGPSGRLVLAVPVARRAAEDGDDDLGSEPANDPDHVFQDRVAGPVLPGLVQRLGVAEIVGTGEVLPGTVQAPGRQQLFG